MALSGVERGLTADRQAEATGDPLGTLLAPTVARARECVQRAGLTDSTLDAIGFSGGSSALRPFQRALQAECPRVTMVEGDLSGGVASGLVCSRA